MSIRWWSAGLADLPSDDAWIDSTEADRFAAMRFRKRRDEAMLARWTAKSTVARSMDMPTDPASLSSITVRNASDGAPEVFISDSQPGVIIAMTDRADWAVAAVRRGEERIGCDLELTEPRSDAFVRDYFTPSEQATVASTSQPDLVANLIWSAKESALKVLRTGLRRDTRTVEVEFEPGSHGWNPLMVSSAEGKQMPGWWARYGEFILTMAAEVETEPPISMEEPPPLALAIPGHQWLSDPLTEERTDQQHP